MKKQVSQYCTFGPRPCPTTSVKLRNRLSRSMIRINIFSLSHQLDQRPLVSAQRLGLRPECAGRHEEEEESA